MIKGMEKEKWNMIMEMNIMDIGKMIKKMVLEKWYMIMKMNIMENGKMICL